MNTFQINALNLIQQAMSNSYSEFQTPKGEEIHFDEAIARVSNNKAIAIHNRLSNETMILETTQMEHLKRIITVFIVFGSLFIFAFWWMYATLSRY